MPEQKFYDMPEPKAEEQNPASIYYYIVAAREIQDQAFKFIDNLRLFKQAYENATAEEKTLLHVACYWAVDFQYTVGSLAERATPEQTQNDAINDFIEAV